MQLFSEMCTLLAIISSPFSILLTSRLNDYKLKSIKYLYNSSSVLVWQGLQTLLDWIKMCWDQWFLW